MKVTRSVRLSEETMKAVAFLQRRQGDDASDAIRRLVRRGLESELSELYSRGEISLRHAADLLSLTVRECLELFALRGVSGNVTMAQAFEAHSVADCLAD